MLERYKEEQKIYWSLVDGENWATFKESLQTAIPNSEITTIPVDIMHGKIGFRMCLRMNGVQQNDKEKPLNTIIQTGVPLHKNAEEYWNRMKREYGEMSGHPRPKEEIDAEIKTTFSKYLFFIPNNQSPKLFRSF